MATETFTLKSREEVKRFEELLDAYVVAITQMPLKHLSLTDAYESCLSNTNGNRIFSALLDIQMSFTLVYLDLHSVGAIWNENFSNGKLEGGSVLDTKEKFFGKMEIHRFNTAFVLRYRALWDKLMGLIILMKAPNNYDSFIGAKSRKKAFVKTAMQYKFAEQGFIDKLNDLLSRFDDKFRTSEAHGTGVLRKYSFTMESMAENPLIELINFWNAVNCFIAEIGKQFLSKNEAPEASLKPPNDPSYSIEGD